VRPISQEKALSLVAGISPAAMDAAQADLPRVAAGQRDDWLSYAVAEGFFNATEVQLDSVPAGSVFWYLGRSRDLCIVAAHSLDKKRTILPYLIAAVRQLSEREGATCIRFETMRPGMIRELSAAGFSVVGVIMHENTKKDSPNMKSF
jgi:hypothetical protein